MSVLQRVLALTLLEQVIVGAVRPVAVYRALAHGAGPIELGIIASTYAVAAIVVAMSVGRRVTASTASTVTLVGSLGVAVGCAGLALSDGLVAITVAHGVVGAGQMLVMIGVQAMLMFDVDRTSAKRNDGGFGLYTAAASLGQIVGPAALMVVIPAGASLGGGHGYDGPGATWILLGGAALASLMLPLSRVAAPRTPALVTAPSAGIASLFRNRVVMIAIVTSLLLTSTMDLLTVYLPAYGEARGWSVQAVGLLLALRAGGSLSARIITGPLLARLGLVPLLIWSLVVPATALVVLALAADVLVAAGAMLAIGFWLGAGVPITLFWVSRETPPETVGTAIGLRLSGNRVGQIVFPLAAGTLGGALGMSVMFAAVAMPLVLAAAFLARDPLRRQA